MPDFVTHIFVTTVFFCPEFLVASDKSLQLAQVLLSESSVGAN
jgi:hypothetical protein